MPVKIEVYQTQQLVHSGEFEGTIELGRCESEAEQLFARSPTTNGRVSRLCIANWDEKRISRAHVKIEVFAFDRLQINNLSRQNPILIQGVGPLLPLATQEATLPAEIRIGDRTIRLERMATERPELQSLMQPTMVPGSRSRHVDLGPLRALEEAPASLVAWFQAVTELLHSAASSSDFFQLAAQGLVDLIGLDCGRVLLWDGHTWKSVIVKMGPHLTGYDCIWPASNQILRQVLEQVRTLWQLPSATASLADVQAVIAAPILNPDREVIGVLYGDRLCQPNRSNRAPITTLEATLVETLACGIAAGLARLKGEQAALEAQVRFEQFFTPELSRQLAAEPDLLTGRDAQVTLLFCDVRGFSRISERLKNRTFEWIQSVMNGLSEQVAANQGVLVDYIGDELMAMWGAPTTQADQAELACRAALGMLRWLPEHNRQWQAELGEPVGVGIGINTGPARVGNTGSQRKFKYGPLGPTVNLASRVQGVTKYLKTNCLITQSTRSPLSADLPCRRVCRAEVVNIAERVELFELSVETDPAWKALQFGYEEALVAFEQQNFRRTIEILGQILSNFPDDGPSLVLLSRAVECMVRPPQHFDATWILPGK